MPTFHYTVGLPGSGKTTWAKAFVADAQSQPSLAQKIVRVNRDDLRGMLHDGVYSPENERVVRKVQEDIIDGALRRGFDVVVDDTNLDPRQARELADIVRDVNGWMAEHGHRPVDMVRHDQFLQVPLAVCIARDAVRTNRVGAQVIADLANKWSL